VPEVRRAVREEIKRGAQHIQLMLSGDVASPTDRVDSTQFSEDEIRAAVEEAEAANIYVLGHAYTSRAINRGLTCGVRTIEHGNLMDPSSLPLFLAHGAYYVPTLVTYSALAEHGREYGLPQSSYDKVFDLLDAGLRALEMADKAGLSIAYGTDLLGGMHASQSRARRPPSPRGWCGWKARSASSRQAPSPTCWSWTAIRWTTSASSPIPPPTSSRS
jgi:imidazolonepropionase-like amidohydrolase